MSKFLPRIFLLTGVAAIYLAIFFGFDRLRFELRTDKDEGHFWKTSLRFSEQWIPSVELLRDYGELSTPLPFLLFGWLERASHAGPSAARLLNFIASFAMVGLMILVARGSIWRIAACVLALLAWPYYLGVSIHVYTDILAGAGALGGVWLCTRNRPILGALAFALAIACRQYMVAFPIAMMIHALLARDGSSGRFRSWLAPALAAGTLGGWIMFFGGFGPPGEVERQGVSSAGMLVVYPAHGLYFLACIGACFVVPELVLLDRRAQGLRIGWMRATAVTIVIAVLFVCFPPVGNPEPYPIKAMGYMDVMLRRIFDERDFLRIIVLALLALLAAIRFARFDLASIIIWMNALILIKAHIGWDKYALPALVVLWFLTADRTRTTARRFQTSAGTNPRLHSGTDR